MSFGKRKIRMNQTVKKPKYCAEALQLIDILERAGKCRDEKRALTYHQALIDATRTAFMSTRIDFVAQVLSHFDDMGCDYPQLMDMHMFFEAMSSEVFDENGTQWRLIAIPFLASSAYGLPHGRLPKELLEAVYARFAQVVPKNFTVRVNSDILNPEHFALTPLQMQNRIRAWVKKTEPGICTFCKSEEDADEVNDLVADIRVIGVIIESPEALTNVYSITAQEYDALKDGLAEDLYKYLKKHYLATKFELILKHSQDMQEYLERTMLFDEEHREMLIDAPVHTLTEAGRLFRYFSFKEALTNLRQTYSYSLDDLRLSIGRFYETPSMGCVTLSEFRIGIGKKDEKQKVLQGICWPLFQDEEHDSLNTLLNVMRVADIKPENICLLDGMNYMVEDEDEEAGFPTWDGKLKEPESPEDAEPIRYTLN